MINQMIPLSPLRFGEGRFLNKATNSDSKLCAVFAVIFSAVKRTNIQNELRINYTQINFS